MSDPSTDLDRLRRNVLNRLESLQRGGVATLAKPSREENWLTEIFESRDDDRETASVFDSDLAIRSQTGHSGPSACNQQSAISNPQSSSHRAQHAASCASPRHYEHIASRHARATQRRAAGAAVQRRRVPALSRVGQNPHSNGVRSGQPRGPRGILRRSAGGRRRSPRRAVRGPAPGNCSPRSLKPAVSSGTMCTFSMCCGAVRPTTARPATRKWRIAAPGSRLRCGRSSRSTLCAWARSPPRRRSQLAIDRQDAGQVLRVERLESGLHVSSVVLAAQPRCQEARVGRHENAPGRHGAGRARSKEDMNAVGRALLPVNRMRRARVPVLHQFSPRKSKEFPTGSELHSWPPCLNSPRILRPASVKIRPQSEHEDLVLPSPRYSGERGRG